MIICIPSLSEKAASGKSFFCERLSVSLKKLGIGITSDIHKPHDVSLNIVFLEKTKIKAKSIVRLDGIWHNIKQKYKKQNNGILKNLKKADGVVYQTKFCKKASDRYIKKIDVSYDIIFNGTNLDAHNDVEPVIVDGFDHCFIAYSRWRPHKRLRESIKCFLHANVKGSCLFVAGDISKCGNSSRIKKYFRKEPNIKYLGNLSQRKLASYLKNCDASIHLSWIDWCPNSVVEAIAAGVPVITNNVGGTQELVRPGGGIVCNIDKPWDFKPCDLYNPPSFDRDIVANAIVKCSKKEIHVKNTHVDIDKTAKQYESLFKKVLSQ